MTSDIVFTNISVPRALLYLSIRPDLRADLTFRDRVDLFRVAGGCRSRSKSFDRVVHVRRS